MALPSPGFLAGGYIPLMRRHLQKFGSRLALGLALVTALTGCLKLDIDGKVRTDTKIDGKMIVGFSDQMLDLMGSLDDSGKGKSKGDLIKELQKPTGKLPAGVTSKGYRKNGFVGQEITFKGQDASKVLELGNDTTSKAGGSTGNATDNKSTLSITKVGGKMILKGKLDMGGDTGTDSSGLDLGSMMKTMKPEMRIRFTFPGTVIKSNGKVSGKSVTWVPVLGKNLTMTAEANAS